MTSPNLKFVGAWPGNKEINLAITLGTPMAKVGAMQEDLTNAL